MKTILLCTVLGFAFQVRGCGSTENIGKLPATIETEHLRAVPVLSMTDKAELEDMEFFRRNGMDGGRIRVDGKEGVSRHRNNGSWFVEYLDGTTEALVMTNPRPGAYVLICPRLLKRLGR
jgi:hypothetical protein